MSDTPVFHLITRNGELLYYAIMKTLFYSTLAVFICTITALNSFGQIAVTTGQTAQQLAEFLAGANITVTNATLTGSGNASGQFTGNNSSVGFDSGVLLSTGNVTSSSGPNNQTNSSQNNGSSGTAQMTSLAGVNTFDAVTLEFDFEVQSSFIQFNYVFASEEYPEYAPPNNSNFNDVFAFFISGPGITGEENIALVPNTTNPVTIGNINPVTNSQYYNDNTGGTDIQFDGYTTILQAKRTGLTPCQVYHLKLVIADAGDAAYNSAVFLQENSLVQGLVDVQTQTVNSDNIALEGCIKASFTFAYDDASNQDRIIDFIIGGTAVNGVDYQFIDNQLTIVAGDTSATIYVDAFSDGLTEGQETIWIAYQPEACADYDTVYLYINDAQPIDFTLDEFNLNCYNDASGEIQVNASGGFPPYTYSVTGPNNASFNTQSNPITGLAAGQYSVQVIDSYGCQAEALVVGGVFDADTTFLPDVPNGQVTTYDAPLVISGFNPGQTITNVNQIQQICLTMEHSYLGDLKITVESPSGQVLELKPQNGGGSCDLGEPFASAAVDGQNSNLTDPGVGYEYCFNANPVYGTMVQESGNFTHTIPSSTGGTYTDNYLPAGSYTASGSFASLVGSTMNGTWTVHVTDQFALDNGYIFNWYISLIGDFPDTTVVLTQPDEIVLSAFVQNATCGGSDGSISASVTGAVAPYTVSWNTGQTTETITGLSAGTYEMTVTDANGCQSTESFFVNNIGSLSISASSTATSCSGGSNGAINISPAGGTTPYTFSWSNGAITEDISGLSAGNYTVTMTDNGGCVISQQVTVSDATPITIGLLALNDEQCSTDNGSIDIQVSGGTNSFGYSWSNGATTQDITGLTSGTYTVNVVDGNGCTASHNYTIFNDVSNCSAFCFISAVENTLVDEMCGQGNGSIDIDVLNAVAPVTYTWSNGATSEDLSGLSAGTYTVVVTDANNCSESASFTIGNNTGNLVVSNVSVNEENCSNSNGSINITVSGGAMPYAYSWSNGATSEDLTGLVAGNYTVTVTDGNGCSVTHTYTVVNNSGTLAASATVTSELCTSSNGAINQTITGGNGGITYSWSSGQTTQDLTGLQAGTYTCTITDQTGCYIVESYTVGQSSGNISLAGTNVTNETCGNGQGAINITVTGNNLSYLWSNGATTEDLVGISAGNYSCSISNTSGCTFTTGTIAVINTSGTLNVTTQLITNEVCGNANGSVNVNVTNGTAPYTYSWSNGATTEDIIGLTAGIYTITVTDANGCTESHSVTVGSSNGTLSIQNGIITNEVCGNGSGAIDLVVSGGAPALSYAWSSGQTTQDITGLSAGTYTVTVTDNNGCQESNSYVVINQASNLAFTSAVTNEICSNGLGEIALNLTGGAVPYTFNWSNGSTAQTATGLSAGSYSCTITDNAGCSIVTGNISVGNTASGLSASTAITNAVCTSNGSIDLTVVGGAAPLTFTWSNGASTEDISGLAAGSYTYTVTDANSCTLTGVATVAETNGNITYTYTTASEICGNGLGEINLSVTGGAAPYTFAWSNAATSEDLTGLSAGAYTCTITDANGCSVTTNTINVTNLPGNLSISNVVVTNETCSNGYGGVDISITGGAAPISYAWSNGATTQDIVNMSAGTYTVTVTDNNGCQATTTSVVNSAAGSLTIASGVVTNESCSAANGAINISISGAASPISYQWSNGATTQDLTGLSAGSYTVSVTDGNGCTVSHTYSVSNTGVSLAISNSSVTDEFCSSGSGSINVDVSGGTPPYSYAWSNGGTNDAISNLSAGTYTVTVTDGSGCSISSSYVVNNNAGTLAVSGMISDETCGDGAGAINITTTGGNGTPTYSWSSGQTTEDLTGLSAGTYNLIVTDTYGCTANYSGTVNNISGGLGVTIASTTDESCGQANGAIDATVTGTGPFTYVWNTGQTTEDLTGLSAGAYSLTVTNNLGCSVSASTTVANITGTMAISFVNEQDENCGNGQGFVDIEVTGGQTPYTYTWSNGQTTQDAVNLGAGTYSVVVTDNLGCQLSATYSISNQNNTNLSATASVTDAICSQANGGIDLQVIGGIANFSFNWDNGATTEDISGLGAGTYAVTITDNVGCEVVQSFSVGTQSSGLAFTNLNIQDDFCGQGNGQIDIFTGGTADDYFVDGVNNGGATVQNLAGGTYLIAITDNNGCYVDSLVTVGNQAFFNVNGTSTDETCQQGNGSIDITITNGGGPGGTYTYLWSNGATTEDISGLSAGTYTVTVTSGGGFPCSVDYTIVVDNVSDFEIAATTTSDYCGQSSGGIDQTLVFGSGVTYLWSNGATTQDITGVPAGNYSCTVSMPGGCAETFDYVVGNQSNGTIATAAITDEECSNSGGEIDLTVSGGSGLYDFLWSNAATTEDLAGLSGNTYTVTITDQGDNCVITETYTIANTDHVFAGSGAIIDATCATCADGSIDLSLNPGSYTFEWSNLETTEDISGLNPGTYSVIVTTDTGCDTTLSFVVGNTASLDEQALLGILVSIHPNPANDYFVVVYDMPFGMEGEVVILDAAGRHLKSSAVTGSGEMLVDASELSSGIYFVNLQSNKFLKMERLIVSNNK